MTTKKTRKPTAPATPAPARKKLTLKKDTLKDLSASHDKDQDVKGGYRTYSCTV